MYCRHSQMLHKIQFMAFHSPLMWTNAQNLIKSLGGCQFIDGWQVILSVDVLKLTNINLRNKT